MVEGHIAEVGEEGGIIMLLTERAAGEFGAPVFPVELTAAVVIGGEGGDIEVFLCEFTRVNV